MSAIIKRLTKGDLFVLFLIVAFPIHAWSIFMILQDFQWVMERTVSIWDGIGYASYSLVFALFESIVIFIIVVLLSMLLPKRWNRHQVLAGMGLTVFTVSFWTILNQLYFFYNTSTLVRSLPNIFIGLEHPIRVFYLAAGALFILILASIIIPLFLIHRSKPFLANVTSIMDRLIILSGLYILFDIMGVIVIVIRNV